MLKCGSELQKPASSVFVCSTSRFRSERNFPLFGAVSVVLLSRVPIVSEKFVCFFWWGDDIPIQDGPRVA